MKLGLYCSPLGGVTPPFGHSRKEVVTAAIIAGAATVAAAAGTAISNASSVSATNKANKQITEDTNATNLQIARETNEMSQHQFNKNMEWLQTQFAKEREYALEDREYNSIENQVNRAVAAGINPSAIIGNGSAAHQTTPVSSVGAPSQSNFQAGYAQASHAEPTTFDFSGLSEGIGHAVDAYYQNKLVKASSEKANYDTQIASANAATQLWENVERIQNMIADTDYKISQSGVSKEQKNNLIKQREMLEEDLKFARDSYHHRMKQLETGNALMDAQASKTRREERYIDFEQALAVKRLEIDSALAKSNIQLNSAQLSQLIMNLGKIAAETDDIKSDTALKKIQKEVIKAAEFEKKGKRNILHNSELMRRIHATSRYIQDIIFGEIFHFIK